MTVGMRPWRIGALAALLAMIVRLAVPIGFMPMAGAAALVPCPAQTVMPPTTKMPAMHGMHHGNGTHDDHEADPHGCPFAGVGVAADVVAPALALAMPASPIALAIVLPFAAMPGLGLAAPPPPKTGPPPPD